MDNDKSIYACYEEVRQREIKELKEKLKDFGGEAHFGADYIGEGATGVDFPIVCVNSDNGPYDARIHAVKIDDSGALDILACPLGDDYPHFVKVRDIIYGNLEFITDSLPVRTFSKESFCISRLSREDMDDLGFDTSDVDDKTMERIASKLGDDYCEQLFWTSLEIIAEEGFDIPRKDDEVE